MKTKLSLHQSAAAMDNGPQESDEGPFFYAVDPDKVEATDHQVRDNDRVLAVC